MSSITSQADDYLPTSVLRYVGGMRTYAARINFFLGVPNTLMIGVLFYGDSKIIQSLFPTVYHWVGFVLLVAVPMAVVVDRVLLHPAQIVYNAHQSSHTNRNPTYRLVQDNNQRLQALEDQLNEDTTDE